MLRVAGVESSSIVDGPGFRYTVFLQGCSHRCSGCQNPSTWDREGGTLMDTQDLLADIKKAYYIDGVTVSGGEPLDQGTEVLELLSALKAEGYHIILYSGYTFEEIMAEDIKRECMRYVDILVDGEYKKEERSLELRFRGSKNQRVIDVQKSITQKETALIDW